jgi:cytochrome c oxidase accessory protein FixG
MDEQGTYRDKISTVDDAGKRVWIYPKKPKGIWYERRKWLSYFFLAILFAAPHIKINDEPLLLFNIIERKFVIFGNIFWPQDLYLFAIAMIVGIVFIILFTIIYGRLFCGWACPQTIFMEMVFRRIEYWIEGDWKYQQKLDKQPWNTEKIIKKFSKHTIFWLISFLIANTFLAYIIGADKLWEIQTDPVGEHLGGLISIVVFTSVFYGVFARLREQVCTTICPYGRLQGVLLDPNTMVVGYDHKRGEGTEGRAKFKKNEDRAALGKGDCIDCARCVHVCPTGIDIRNGTQLECINCTACIDECDDVMTSIQKPKGLVRFVSENGIKTGNPFQWTRRVLAYTTLLAGLLTLLLFLMLTRKDFHTSILRQRGTTYQVTEDRMVSNIFELNLTNKTKNKYSIELVMNAKDGKIEVARKNLVLKPEEHLKERFIIKVPFESIKDGKRIIQVRILGNKREIQKKEVKFIGPIF